MRQLPVGIALGVAMIAAVVVSARTVATPGSASGSEGGIKPVLSPVVPKDLLLNPDQADAVAFAWGSFVAVNWPARAGARGVPDLNKKIGQPGDVVWDTWKSPGEVFTPDGRPPAGWNEYGDKLPSICTQAGAASTAFWLRRVTKVPGNTGNAAMERAREAVGGTLTDQHGNLVRFDVRLNKVDFDNIVANVYYNAQGQDSAKVINMPPGVMEAKASWREMTDSDTPQIRRRFYRRIAWIYTPATDSEPPTCIKSEVGLVGLHLTQKTPSRPQWTWATFEQVDNVPPFVPPGDTSTPPPSPVPYSFNNPLCPPTQCVPNQSTEKNGHPTGIPTQVTRVVNIGAAAQQANPVWQAALARAVGNSPFQYYELVDIQWPQNPAQRPAGNPAPGLLSNTTMETYVVESSCLNCHYTARTASGKLSSDFSFLLGEAHRRTGGGGSR